MAPGARRRPPRPLRRARRRGAALILVVVVVAALLAIAAPFVASMRLHERSARAFAGKTRARLLARGARNDAVAHLMRTHPDEERRAREARNDRTSDDEGVDTQDELEPAPLAATGLRPLDAASATGGLATIEVDDARGRIDLNCSGPDPIANLLGCTITTAVLSYDEDEALYVEDASPFYCDGDPKTIDGFVRLNHEYIAYRDIERRPPARSGDPDRPCLTGLVRGAFFSRNPPPEDRDLRRSYHGRGSLVQDGRGYKIAFDALWRWLDTDRHGELARFDSPAAIRRIADWEFGRLRAAMVLERYGVTLERLRGWGIQRGALERAGLDPAPLDEEAARKDETKEERDAREKAERTLRAAGVSPDSVRRFGGDKAVTRIAQALDALDDEQRAKVVAQWKERAEQLEAQAKKLDDWLKDEMKRQLRDLSELRDEAPHLETIGRVELEEKIRPFTTTDAPPTAEAWSDPRVNRNRLQYQPYAFAASIRLQDTRRFAEGMICRVRPLGGGPTEFRSVVQITPRDAVHVFPQLDREYEAHTAEVSVRVPTPVNVNTARRAVLAAVLTGIQSRVAQRSVVGEAPDFVTPREARAIAEAIAAEPPTDFLALRALLLELRAANEITDHDVDAVVRNAIDPGDALLTRSTVPFCFVAGDVYELQATGIVSDPAGVEVARHRTREVARVAPPRDLVWTIDSQADLQDRLWVGGPVPQGLQPAPRDGGGVAWLHLPHCQSELVQTRPSYMGPYGARAWITPSRSHAPGEGDLQPLLSHEPFQLAQGSNASGGLRAGTVRDPDHWDGELEGVAPQRRVPGSQLGHRFETRESQVEVEMLGPTQLRAWFRLDRLPGAGQRAYLLDGGKGEHLDRISLYLEGGDLVLAAKDEALDARESALMGTTPRAAQLRWRPNPPLVPGNWYHVSAWWKGTDRGDLALAVDGRLVGRETHGSRLVQAIDPWQSTITLEDASGFPAAGWVRIGHSRRQQGSQDRGLDGQARDVVADRCEVLHYSQKIGNTLTLDTGNNLVNDAVLQVQSQGGRVTGITPTPQGASTSTARRPQRSSGRRYQVQWVNAQNRAQQPITVSMGYPHDAGTLVVPYGYHSRLKDEAAPPPGGPRGATPPPPAFRESLRRGGATLVEALPIHTPSTVLYQPVPGYTQAAVTAALRANPPRPFDLFPQVIDATQTSFLPVLWVAPTGDAPMNVQAPPRPPLPPGVTPQASPPQGVAAAPNVLGGWPSRGVVRVSSNKIALPGLPAPPPPSVELIGYGAIDRVGGRLLNLTRGLGGTTPAAHFLWDSVSLESIVVSDATDYADRPALTDPLVHVSLQAGGGAVEWLSVKKPDAGLSPQERALLASGVLYLPARDSLDASAAAGGPGLLPVYPYVPDLIAQMLTNGGSLALGGLTTIIDPTAYDFGQPHKEVLKRWDLNGSRARKGTGRPPSPGHAVGARVVPTFAVRVEDRFESGAGDVVTITDDQPLAPAREEKTIVHAARADRGSQDPCDGWLIAFDDFVARRYEGSQHARLARWPVGSFHSLPDLELGQARAPSGPGDTSAFAPGTLTGRIDDLVVRQLTETGVGDAVLAIDEVAGPFQGRPNQWRDGRLVKWDDEVVAFVDATPGTPPAGAPPNQPWSQVRMLRGALGTAPAAHSRETHGWDLDWPPYAIADGPIGGNRGQVIPTRGVNGDFREWDGYVAIDRGGGQPWAGVLPFARRRGRQNLHRPLDHLDRGAFGTAFGASAAAPAAADLLIDLPFRQHDVYGDRISSIEGVHFQAARELPGCYVTRVDWDETLPGPFCEVKVALRVDGAPGWDAEPADRPGLAGRLYLFDDPREPNEVLVRATRVEVRVYLTFKPGALYRDAWKRAAVLGALRIHYRQPSAALRVEERAE